MNKKVIIVVSKGRYHPSHKNGAEYVSVDYSASTYGGASPCDTVEQKNSAIKTAQKRIREEGDIPVVNDQTEKRTLSSWM